MIHKLSIKNDNMHDFEFLGLVEIYYYVYEDGTALQNWEAKLQSGGSDGGTWMWAADELGRPIMALTSNISQGLIATISNQFDWKAKPPLIPWFVTGSKVNFGLIYYGTIPSSFTKYFTYTVL